MHRVDIFIHCLKGGGAERVCVTIANGMADKGIDVRLVTLYSLGEKYKEQINSNVKLINLSEKKKMVRTIILLKEYLTKTTPEIILTFNNNIALILLMLRKFLKRDFKIIARNINTLSVERKYERSFVKKYLFNWVTKKFYKDVDLVICQSKGMANDLIDNYNFSKTKVKVINNPVSDKFINNKIKVNNNVEKKILFVGRLEKQKGLNMLLEAFSYCVREVPEALLTIVGSGYLKDDLVKDIRKLGLEKRVIIEDFTDDIMKHYRESNVTVLSSYYEGFPNVLVESISMGTPVVSFNCPSGPDEIIIDDINGFLVEYLNVEKLAIALKNTLNKSWDKEAIINTSLNYNPDFILDKYLNVLSKV